VSSRIFEAKQMIRFSPPNLVELIIASMEERNRIEPIVTSLAQRDQTKLVVVLFWRNGIEWSWS
jgi:hypothetical protein